MRKRKLKQLTGNLSEKAEALHCAPQLWNMRKESREVQSLSTWVTKAWTFCPHQRIKLRKNITEGSLNFDQKMYLIIIRKNQMTQWAETIILNVFSLLKSLRRLITRAPTIICRLTSRKQRQVSTQLNFITID